MLNNWYIFLIMKSLVEAASSIFKAIEKGWNRAGCPQEFTIKILEKEETNFLGMTRKPAKVALFLLKVKNQSQQHSINKKNVLIINNKSVLLPKKMSAETAVSTRDIIKKNYRMMKGSIVFLRNKE